MKIFYIDVETFDACIVMSRKLYVYKCVQLVKQNSCRKSALAASS